MDPDTNPNPQTDNAIVEALAILKIQEEDDVQALLAHPAFTALPPDQTVKRILDFGCLISTDDACVDIRKDPHCIHRALDQVTPFVEELMRRCFTFSEATALVARCTPALDLRPLDRKTKLNLLQLLIPTAEAFRSLLTSHPDAMLIPISQLQFLYHEGASLAGCTTAEMWARLTRHGEELVELDAPAPSNFPRPVPRRPASGRRHTRTLPPSTSQAWTPLRPVPLAEPYTLPPVMPDEPCIPTFPTYGPSTHMIDVELRMSTDVMETVTILTRVWNKDIAFRWVVRRPWLFAGHKGPIHVLNALVAYGATDDQLFLLVTRHTGLLAQGYPSLIVTLKFLREHRVPLPDDLDALAIPLLVLLDRIRRLLLAGLSPASRRNTRALFAHTEREFHTSISR